jgi:hypothetical protein
MVFNVEAPARCNAGGMAQEDQAPMRRADYPAAGPTTAFAQPTLWDLGAESGVAGLSNLPGALTEVAPKDRARPLPACAQPHETVRNPTPLLAGILAGLPAKPQPLHSLNEYTTTAADAYFESLDAWGELLERELLRRASRSYVYFAKARGVVKIGMSCAVDNRMATLRRQTGLDIRLEAAVPGYLDAERRLHERFAAGRLYGEWFYAGTPGLFEMRQAAEQFEALPWDLESPGLQPLLEDLGLVTRGAK